MKSLAKEQGDFVQRWNKIFVLCCCIAIAIDPLFLYIPMIIRGRSCLSVDTKIAITTCFIRSLLDIVYLFRIILQFRTCKGYLCSYFFIDLLSILPLPQVGLSYIAKGSDATKAAIFIQFIPRIWRMYPLYMDVTPVSGILTEIAWAGAVSNFILYILSSHVIGSFWYLMSIERVDTCWRLACEARRGCKFDDLYCGGGHRQRDNSFLVSSCSPSSFDYGIFLDALSIQHYPDFSRRFFYCFVWGLRNLSSLGQNLEASQGVGENLFVVVISIIGLILFSFLAGNIQRYLHSLTARRDEMSMHLQDQEQWMRDDMLPEPLRMRVRRHEQLKWQKKRGVDKESLIQNLPKDLRRDIKRHQCLSLLFSVPVFEMLDERVLDALCCRLKPVLYSADSYILREGDPVDEMLFIKRGDVLKLTITYGSGSGSGSHSFNTVILKAGDFF